MSSSVIAHALVLPDVDFTVWYQASLAYTRAFERVSVVRGLRGVDLNRFHTVTAVTIPGLWFNNDPLTHIRRSYPSVVTVDIIRATTPAALTTLLNERIARQDRCGNYLKDDHLNTRFTIAWPGDARPAKILTPFAVSTPNLNGGTRPNEGIIYHAPAGSTVRAAAPGIVLLVGQDISGFGWGTYVVVGTTHVVTTGRSIGYQIVYANLQAVSVRAGQSVTAEMPIGTAAGPAARLMVVQVGTTTPGFVLNGVIDPSPLIYWPELRVRTSVDGLRVRERPGTQYRSIGQVYVGDLLESLEMPGKTLEKLGDDDSWLRIRTPANLIGYCAAWLLNSAVATSLSGVDIKGMNLDFLHPLGAPAANRLRGISWLRFPYKATVSQGFGSLDSAHAFYQPKMQAYVNAGHKLIVILTHQTFGEGAGYNWEEMYSSDRGRWNEFIDRFADAARCIARRYAGTGLVTAYQIWNEQDTPPGQGVMAAVPMLSADYAKLLAETTRAIRSVDPEALVIPGGHIGGPVVGANYARAVISLLPGDALPDGVACHSYGRGAPTSPPDYTGFGSIADEINAYERVMSGVPVWITEWGVLDRDSDPADGIARYAREFIQYVRSTLRRKTVTAVWYAFADTMHNGYGLVDENDRPKYPLYDEYLNA